MLCSRCKFMKIWILGVPQLHSFYYRGSHYREFCLIYAQVGDFCISRGPSTVPLTRILRNVVFSKSQNPRKVGTLCNPYHPIVFVKVTFFFRRYYDLYCKHFTVLFIILSPLAFFLEIMIILKIDSHPPWYLLNCDLFW